jgi:outer membrane protein assembly factor BamE
MLHFPQVGRHGKRTSWSAFMPLLSSHRDSAGARSWLRGLGTLLLVAGLSACSSVPTVSGLGNMVSPYRIDIVQGNVVTREQAAALRPGMPREQVRDVLGTPLLASVFHANRWDYVFTFRRQGQEIQKRKLAVFFRDNLLERVEADELPTESEFVSSLDVKTQSGKPLPLEATEEQLRRFRESNPVKPVDATPAEPVAAPPASYPPLEPAGATR